MNGPFGHHWSGWPGAFCYKCGREDPHEAAMAHGDMYFDGTWENPELLYKSPEVQERIRRLDRCPIYGVLVWNRETNRFDLQQEEPDDMTQHNIQQHMDLMGRRVRDRVTKFSGVVTSIAFDLYGCVTCVVTPVAEGTGEVIMGMGAHKLNDAHWFDHKRLEVLDPAPVMALPWFATADNSPVKEARKPGDENGPEAKPIISTKA